MRLSAGENNLKYVNTEKPDTFNNSYNFSFHAVKELAT